MLLNVPLPPCGCACGSYFFAVVTERRQPILIDPAVRLALREAIVSVRQTLPFRIDGWVLLPDHLHAIWTLPDGDADFSNRWRLIKRHVTTSVVLIIAVLSF